jgi:hypothetical protein
MSRRWSGPIWSQHVGKQKEEMGARGGGGERKRISSLRGQPEGGIKVKFGKWPGDWEEIRDGPGNSQSPYQKTDRKVWKEERK